MALRLMCERDFKPEEWGGIGFSREPVQTDLINNATIVAVYITRDNRDINKRGIVAGFVEISGEIGHIRRFITPQMLQRYETDRIRRNGPEWSYSVGIKRAWKVIGFRPRNVVENWEDVKTIFPNTCRNNTPRNIGGRTAIVEVAEADFSPIEGETFVRLNNLKIQAVGVHEQNLPLERYATARALLANRGLLV